MSQDQGDQAEPEPETVDEPGWDAPMRPALLPGASTDVPEGGEGTEASADQPAIEELAPPASAAIQPPPLPGAEGPSAEQSDDSVQRPHAEGSEGSELSEVPEGAEGAAAEGEGADPEGEGEGTDAEGEGDAVDEEPQTRGLFDVYDPRQRFGGEPDAEADATPEVEAATIVSSRKRRAVRGPEITPGAPTAAPRVTATAEAVEPPSRFRAVLWVIGTIVVGAGAGILIRGTSDLPGTTRAEVMSLNPWVYVYIAVLGVAIASALVLILSSLAAALRDRPNSARNLQAGAALAVVAVVGLVLRSKAEETLRWEDEAAKVQIGGDQVADAASVPSGKWWVGAYKALPKDTFSHPRAEEYVKEQRKQGISYASLVDGSRDLALDDDPQGDLDSDEFLVVFGWAPTRDGVENFCRMLQDFPVDQDYCQARHVEILRD